MLRIETVLVPREKVQVEVAVDGRPLSYDDVPTDACGVPAERGPDSDVAPAIDPEGHNVTLGDVANGRSGDKGDNVNIGIIARHPDLLPVIAAQLTADAVGEWLNHLGASSVDRFTLPGTNALNFLLHQGLGSSGAASLRIDPQGKAVAQQLLDFPITIPNGLKDLI